MKILVTGSNGFIGKNLCHALENKSYQVLKFEREHTVEHLAAMINECDFVMHLAGVNRPLNSVDFYDGNVNFTTNLLEMLEKEGRSIPVLFSSSLHAEKDNDYGKSKYQAEKLLLAYSSKTESPVYIYRLANAFGKWCKPNYNSVIATFCYNVCNNLPIQIHDELAVIPFVYIDDIVTSFINCIKMEGTKSYYEVEPIYLKNIKEVATLLNDFKQTRINNLIPSSHDDFSKKLYSTYLSYLREDEFAYDLKMNIDARGSFTEFLKSECQGQISINTIKQGIVKGNHWHHSKNEKFLIVYGQAKVRFRKIGSDQVVTYDVSSDLLKVIDIPCGYTHNIENVGSTDLVSVMWANEPFDEKNPDTYYEEV